MDKIEVTQNARQAAFDAYLTCYEIVPNDLWLQALLDGKHDSDEMAQAFARFERDILATRTDTTPVAWMPIESAPKDGTTILLGAPAQTFQGKATEPRSTIGHWTTKEECREVIGDCGGECRCPEYRYHEPYWLSWDGGFTEQNPPTHWMPLPAAPDATHPPATDVAALVEAAKDALPFMTQFRIKLDGEIVGSGIAYQNLNAALAPFTKGQNDEHS